MAIGEKIRRLRDERKMTQQELAEQLGKSRAAIGKYETGVRLPDNQTLHAICDFFDVTTDYLLGRSEQRQTAGPLSLEQCLAGDTVLTFRGQRLTKKEKDLLLSMAEAVRTNFSHSD